MDLTKEHDYWFGEFKKALLFLKQGKLKFTPHTTNSDVDYFLEKHGHLLLEEMHDARCNENKS